MRRDVMYRETMQDQLDKPKDAAQIAEENERPAEHGQSVDRSDSPLSVSALFATARADEQGQDPLLRNR